MSTFLIVLRLSLFMEHTESLINTKLVEEIVNFNKRFWEKLEDKDEKLINKFHGTGRLSHLVCLEDKETHIGELKIHGTEKWYPVAMKIVEYWAEENRQPGYEFKSGGDNNQNQLVEIINHMILYSNPDLIDKCNKRWDKKFKDV
ncbi:hypothetical protein PGTUg99_030929 [Puccinia graminis f. sp. tritici]|uniref:Uncharacterized protein n=1 Tax=Puccinia graminis f. sp. tritici TaxID=56615 RepID=A0A5B0SL82_PUCGR|nr:hypothetical protein PGTUg99_030929 [Puccinia graminis f. sp. tritici]